MIICYRHSSRFEADCKYCQAEKESFEFNIQVSKAMNARYAEEMRNRWFGICIDKFRRDSSIGTYRSRIMKSTTEAAFEMLEPWQKMYVMNVFNNAGRL